ncbi:MAG: hypothetical protein GY948_16045 [Alphaproteobacteria bacterium]|nr:hypothetical protein [Alphaproteobacteria bacterium]
MAAIIKLLTALAGPKLSKWLAGLAAAIGGLLALLVARQRGRAQGRAEVRAKNAHALARRRAELGEVRERQLEAANKRPETGELDKILDEGKF